MVGYVDIIGDIFAVATLLHAHRYSLAGANIGLIVFFMSLCLLPVRTPYDFLMTVLLMRPLLEGIKSVQQGEETPAFAIIKKIDAVSRSIPSAVLQLYTVLISLSNSNFQKSNPFSAGVGISDEAILLTSVAFSIAGTAMTLASFAPSCGSDIFAPRFFVHYLLFISEGVFRVVTLSILFVTLQKIAFLFIVVDFLFRLGLEMFSRRKFSFGGRVIEKAVIRMGTDVGESKDGIGNVSGLIFSSIESALALILLSLTAVRRSTDLNASATVNAITIIVLLSWFMKIVLWAFIIWILPPPAYSVDVIFRPSFLNSGPVNGSGGANMPVAEWRLSEHSFVGPETGATVAMTRITQSSPELPLAQSMPTRLPHFARSSVTEPADVESPLSSYYPASPPVPHLPAALRRMSSA